MKREIKTPQTHPYHHTVGRSFKAWDGHIYYCDSWEEDLGYWMTQEGNPQVRRNVSERAIGRTFHEIPNAELTGRASAACEGPR